MKPIKSKKAAEGALWYVVIIALLLLFFLVYTGAWSKLFGKGISGINEQIASAEDYDKDRVANFADKCPCSEGDIENDGCPSGYKAANINTGKEDNSCLADKT